MGEIEENENEKPAHKVYLNGYYLMKYEVTVKQFRKFVNETSYRTDAKN